MADFSLGSSGTGRLTAYVIAGQDYPTYANFYYKLELEVRNGAWNTMGDAHWNGHLNGGHAGSGNFTYNSNGWRTLREFSVGIAKDANGYLTVGAYGYINGANGGVIGAGSTSFSIGTTRQGIPPSIASIIADTIQTTTARLGTEINNFGLGTSAACRMYYRIQGSGSGWSQTADANDAAGYNYFNISGLKPGTTYEYFARWWNNNGDTADSGTSTFKTKAVPSIAALLLGAI